MAKKKEAEAEKETSERWLLTYADMITLLLALFVVLYAISAVDAQKYEAIKDAMTEAFEGSGGGGGGGGGGTGPVGFPDSPQILPDDAASPPDDSADRFSELYRKLLAEVQSRGYSNIAVIYGDDAIVVRFRDSVLFYPDQSVMRPEGFTALDNISATLTGMGNAIGHIQIEGHTAFIGEEYERSYAAWDLSAARAIAVLRYLDEQGGIEQSIMNIAGYSHFVPLADNDTEEGRAQNRRVELRISPPKQEANMRG